MADQKEILESIRDIIAGQSAGDAISDDEILELTQMVNDDGSVTEIKPKAEQTNKQANDTVPDNDILSEIDSILNDKPAVKQAEKVELEFSPKHDEPVIEPTSNDEIREQAKELAASPEGFEPPIVAVEEPKAKGDKMDNIENLISQESTDAAKASIGSLMDKLKKEGKEANRVEPSAPFRSGATVEDLVVEMLKPMMKDWLDKNLPKLVNEIVSKEIQKLIPKD